MSFARISRSAALATTTSAGVVAEMRTAATPACAVMADASAFRPSNDVRVHGFRHEPTHWRNFRVVGEFSRAVPGELPLRSCNGPALLFAFFLKPLDCVRQVLQ